MEAIDFTVNGGNFCLNGKPFRILSGAIHYFRVHPDYWYDRLIKLKACGFNTVETYVAWNLHEPEEGKYCFSDFGNIERFIGLAGELGLKVIVRPGPYICAEWEFGGLPGWLMKDREMRLRCAWGPYLEKVAGWFSVLLPRLKPLLCTNGGPIIAMQIENEYGSFGRDKDYLRFIEQLLHSHQMNCLLFTSDGGSDLMLRGGTLDNVLKTVNFGSRPEESFSALRKYQPEGPDMCCEYWCGWFDHWGEKHHERDTEDVANTLDQMLKMGASVNMYMFHGGTNFGFWNGANRHGDEYQPTTTSYDYYAPLNEAGDITDTWHACKRVLEKHGVAADMPVPPDTRKAAYGEIKLEHRCDYTALLPAEGIKAPVPLTMEEIGKYYGYCLYRSELEGPVKGRLRITGLRDRAVVIANGKRVGTLYRNNEADALEIDLADDRVVLDILVENMGRVNYGTLPPYRTGIEGNVLLDYQIIHGWQTFSLPVEQLPASSGQPGDASRELPSVYEGTFFVKERADTFFAMDGFGKGVVFLNGFNLGRYWEIGPQQTLYVPAPILKEGENHITVFETDACRHPCIVSVDRPRFYTGALAETEEK